MSNLSDLISRVRSATGPDRELDAAIDRWLEGWAHERTAKPPDQIPGDLPTITLPTVPNWRDSDGD